MEFVSTPWSRKADESNTGEGQFKYGGFEKDEVLRESMEGVFSTCVNTKTLDEAPMSYKPIEEILKNIKETVKVIKHIKPLYNYKAE